MADKKYLSGNGKEVVFEDGGSVINVYIDLDDAKEKGLIFKTKNNKNGLAFTLARKSEVGEYGDTHYMYHKERSGKTSSPVKKASVGKAVVNGNDQKASKPSDDLPF